MIPCRDGGGLRGGGGVVLAQDLDQDGAGVVGAGGPAGVGEVASDGPVERPRAHRLVSGLDGEAGAEEVAADLLGGLGFLVAADQGPAGLPADFLGGGGLLGGFPLSRVAAGVDRDGRAGCAAVAGEVTVGGGVGAQVGDRDVDPVEHAVLLPVVVHRFHRSALTIPVDRVGVGGRWCVGGAVGRVVGVVLVLVVGVGLVGVEVGGVAGAVVVAGGGEAVAVVGGDRS